MAKSWLSQAFEYVTIKGHEKNSDGVFEVEFYYILAEKQTNYKERVK